MGGRILVSGSDKEDLAHLALPKGCGLAVGAAHSVPDTLLQSWCGVKLRRLRAVPGGLRTKNHHGRGEYGFGSDSVVAALVASGYRPGTGAGVQGLVAL